MDRRFLYHLLKTLRAWRFLLPRSIKRFLPRRLISLALTLLFFIFLLSKFDIPRIFHSSVLPKEDGSIELYSNAFRPSLKQTYLQAISSANKSILVIIYALRDPSIIQALEQQSRRGVKVVVICDAEASQNIGKQFSPSVKVHYQNGAGLMHLKLLVVDLNKVWVGSANFTGDSLQRNGNLVIGVNSPTLANAIQQQANSMLAPPGSLPTYVKVQLKHENVELWFLPNAGKAAFHRLMNILYQAKSTIRIAMYTLTHPRLVDAIIDAHQRGVNVKVILDQGQALDQGAEAYKKLLHAGVSVGLSTKELLHYKMAWIDDSILINGSANWTLSAFNKNSDCFLVLDPLDELQQQEMASLWKVILSESSFKSRKAVLLKILPIQLYVYETLQLLHPNCRSHRSL